MSLSNLQKATLNLLLCIGSIILLSSCQSQDSSNAEITESTLETERWEKISLELIPNFAYDQYLRTDSTYAYDNLKLCFGYKEWDEETDYSGFTVLDQKGNVLFQHNTEYLEWYIAAAFKEVYSGRLLLFVEGYFEGYSLGCTVFEIIGDSIHSLGELHLSRDWRGECMMGLYAEMEVLRDELGLSLQFQTDSICGPNRYVDPTTQNLIYRLNTKKQLFELEIDGVKCMANGVPKEITLEEFSDMNLVKYWLETSTQQVDLNNDGILDLILLHKDTSPGWEQLTIYLSDSIGQVLKYYTNQTLSSSYNDCGLTIDTIMFDSMSRMILQPYFWSSSSSWAGSTQFFYKWDGSEISLVRLETFSISRAMGTYYGKIVDFQAGIIIDETGNEFYVDDPLNKSIPDTSLIGSLDKERLLLKRADPFISWDCEVPQIIH